MPAIRPTDTKPIVYSYYFIILLDLPFIEEYTNPSSNEYKELSTKIRRQAYFLLIRLMPDCTGVTVYFFRRGSFSNVQKRNIGSPSVTDVVCSAEFPKNNHSDAETQRNFDVIAKNNGDFLGDIKLRATSTTPDAAVVDGTIPGYAIALLVILSVLVVTVVLLTFIVAYTRSFSYSFNTGF